MIQARSHDNQKIGQKVKISATDHNFNIKIVPFNEKILQKISFPKEKKENVLESNALFARNG